MSRIIPNQQSSIFIIISLFLLLALSSITEAKQKDGKFATILDEYHSTIKCVINIAEETIPGMFFSR